MDVEVPHDESTQSCHKKMTDLLLFVLLRATSCYFVFFVSSW